MISKCSEVDALTPPMASNQASPSMHIVYTAADEL